MTSLRFVSVILKKLGTVEWRLYDPGFQFAENPQLVITICTFSAHVSQIISSVFRFLPQGADFPALNKLASDDKMLISEYFITGWYNKSLLSSRRKRNINTMKMVQSTIQASSIGLDDCRHCWNELLPV